MTLTDCPECGGPLTQVRAVDADGATEVMDMFCDTPGCGWESVDAELGDAVVEP